jgi:adenylate kinase family enzyme
MHTIPQRILIVGISCTGKTTLAKKLHQRLTIPYTDLDDLHWLPGWKERPIEELRAQVKHLVEQPQWIIAGNYQRTQDLSWPHAELIIWLDFPLWTIYQRLLQRTLQRVLWKQSCCNGNYESWKTAFFSRQSMFVWVKETAQRTRTRYHERLATTPQMVRLRSTREVKLFLKQLSEPSVDIRSDTHRHSLI